MFPETLVTTLVLNYSTMTTYALWSQHFFMPSRRYKSCIPLLILLNLLLHSCQVPSNNICTEEVLLDLNQDSEVGYRGTLSLLSSKSSKSTDSLASASSDASSGQARIPVSNESLVMPLPVVRSTTLAKGLFSEHAASISGAKTTFTTLHDVDTYPAPSSSIVQDSDTFFPVPFRSYRTSSGECVTFRRVADHWQAVLQSGFGGYASKRIMPVVSKEDIGETLSWLQAQDPCISRSRVHLLSQFRAPHTPCVYLGKHGLLGGAPEQKKGLGLAERYHREREERERLQQEQAFHREAYERQLCSLEQTKGEYQRACELLTVECSDLKSDIEELEDYRQQSEATLISFAQERDMYKNQYEGLLAEHSDLKSDVAELEDYRRQHEAILTSFARERDMYKNKYEGLLAEHSDLKSYVVRYQGPERVLFQPYVSGTIFGREAWARYLGDVGVEPPLPSDIDVILNSACPFWLGSKVKDTHLLVLVPAKVRDRPFTLDLLAYLAKNPYGGGHSMRCCYKSNAVKEEFGSQPSSCNAYWILVTKSVIPDSQCKTVEEQESLIADYSRKTGFNYALPSPLEAATAILSHYVRSGERICPDSPRMYTRCAGKVDYIYPVYMGLFSLEGLTIDIDDYDSSSLSGGTLCLCKL
jgi:hypothetical protein